MPNNQETISIKVAVSDAASRPFDQIAEKAKGLGKELETAGKAGTTALGKVDSAAADTAKNIDKRAGDAGDSLDKINKAIDGNVKAFQGADSGIDRALASVRGNLDKVATAGGDAGTKGARALETGFRSADLGAIGRQQGQDAAGGMEQAIRSADIDGAVRQASSSADGTQAGVQLGGDVGGGMATSIAGSDFGGALSDMMDKAKAGGEAAGGKLSGFIAGGLAGLATVIAGIAMEGFSQFQETVKQQGLTEASFGATPEQAKVLGKAAGELYAKGWGEGIGDVTDATRTTASQLGLNADDPAVGGLTRKAMAIAAASGHGVDEITRAANKMVKTGLSKNTEDALDTITKGFQMNLDTSGDMLDTLNEYATQFRKIGIDGPTALGLLSQGLQGGARDTDIVGDAFGEFTKIIAGGGETVDDALGTIGLDVAATRTTIMGGGQAAADATQDIIAKIQSIENPVAQARVWTELFGTQYEDMGGAVNSLDLGTARQQVGDTAGAAEAAATRIEQTSSRWEASWRGVTATASQQFEQIAINGDAMATNLGTSAARGEGIFTQIGNAIQGTGQLFGINMKGLSEKVGGFFDDMKQGAIDAAMVVAEKIGEITKGIGDFLSSDFSGNLNIDANTTTADAAAAGARMGLDASPLGGLGALAGLFGFADGGPITGPGGPRADVIPILASNGEFMVNAADAQANLPLLHHINNGGRFANGGEITYAALTSKNAALDAKGQEIIAGLQSQAAAVGNAISGAVGGVLNVAASADVAGYAGATRGMNTTDPIANFSAANMARGTADMVGPVPPGPAVERWRPLYAHAMQMLGMYSAEGLNQMMHQMDTESSGDPLSYNDWDSNYTSGKPSKGLLQTIPSTFRAHAAPGYDTNIWDPLSNALASLNYAKSRYGSLSAAYRGVAYDQGGPLYPGVTMAVNKSGRTEEVLTAVERSAWVNQVRSGQGGGGRSITIAAGAVQINGANANPQQIAAMVEEALTRIIAEDDERALSG